MFADRITVCCFAASFSVALTFELWNLVRPRPVLRLLGFSAAGAGMLAHMLFLAAQRLFLSSRPGAILFIAWLVTVFYAYAVFRHGKVAWGLFVLPLVLAMYLAQARRLRIKRLPGHGLQLLSLEQLKEIHRRVAIVTFALPHTLHIGGGVP